MNEYTLNQLTTSITDGKHGGCKEVPGSGYYFISVKDLADYEIDYSNAKQISKEDFDETVARACIEAGDTVYANTGDTIGKCVFIRENELNTKTTFQKSVAILKANSEIVSPKFLFYLLKNETRGLREVATGSAQKNLLLSSMRNYKVRIPEMQTQIKISELLGTIDDIIFNNALINQNLEEQTKALFQSMFISSMDSSSWDTGTFSDLIESTLGGDWGKDSPNGNYTEMVYCVRGADIPEVKIGNKGKMPTRYILPKNYSAKQLLPGDIVVEISGGSPTQSTGRVAAVSQSLLDRYDKGMVCTNFCRAIKPKPGYSMFVYYYWQYLYERNVFFSYENGTTGIKNLDLSGFITTEEIVIPPLDLIRKFDDYCQSVFDQTFTNGYENEKLSQLRDTLLPKLMSGELDVSGIDL